MKYRRKSESFEAVQWFKFGDHPAVVECNTAINRTCTFCDQPLKDHGWCSTLEGSRLVCIGDWIVTGFKGWCFVCKPDDFDEKYELAEDFKG